MTTVNTNQRLKPIVSIYDLPLLLQIPQYSLRLTTSHDTYTVKVIAFERKTMIIACDGGDHQSFHVYLGTDYTITLSVKDDPSILEFQSVHRSGSSYTWYLCLVPNPKDTHPNILQAVRQAKGEED